MQPILQFKDSYIMRIINSSRWGGEALEPIQNLSSLGYGTNGIPTHLIDSVSGNNAEILNGTSFQCDESGYYELDTAITLTGDFVIEWDMVYYRNSTYENLTGNNSNSYAGLRFFSNLGNEVLSIRLDNGTSTILSGTQDFVDGTYYKCKVERSSNEITLTINGTAESPVTFAVNDFTVEIIGGTKGGGTIQRKSSCNVWDMDINGESFITFSEPIENENTHISYDISGNDNHASLEGTTSNEGVRGAAGDPLQSGYLDDGVNQVVPILLDGTAFADGTALTDPDAVLNDDTKWLRNGTKLKQSTTEAALITADSQELWYTSGVANEVTPEDVILYKNSYPTIYGAEFTAEYIKGITLTQI